MIAIFFFFLYFLIGFGILIIDIDDEVNFLFFIHLIGRNFNNISFIYVQLS